MPRRWATVGSTRRPKQGHPAAEETTFQRRVCAPKRDDPKKPGTRLRGSLNYTPIEREDIGMELLRRVLGVDETTLTDIRHQPNVGADAVDDQGRYFELEVHSGPIPDAVKLENSQIQRALTTDDIYLIVVGNVETDQGDPEVRIIHDPLHHLASRFHGGLE
jgi:hypothetical protein